MERPMSDLKIGVIVGSLSSTSINRKLAKALVKLAPEKLPYRPQLSRHLLNYYPTRH